MASFALTGYLFGTVIANMSSGFLAVKFGWHSIFYVFGTISIVWYIVWIALVRYSPENDRFITDEERNYIMRNSGKRPQTKVPWKKLFTSIPVYAITIAHFSSNWGFYTLLTQLPSYLKGEAIIIRL
jgi:ACS family sodium-dependent inorganic phosphate cotransporter